MDIKDLLAGGLLGIVAKELFQLFVSRLNHRRERDKLFYTSKLRSSEKLIALYVSYYYQVRTIIEVFTTARVMIEDPLGHQFDEDVLMTSLQDASKKCLELDSKIQDEGAGAFLYVEIVNSWKDADFKEMFDLGNIAGPKVTRYNELLLADDFGTEFQSLQKEIALTLDTAIENFIKFKQAIDEIFIQLKHQARP